MTPADTTPRFDDILQAAERLQPVVHRTGVARSRQIDAAAGCEVFLKCENLQRAGAFKIRGAYNRMAQLDPAARARGVVAYSSGNHAQGVALAARMLGIQATICVPQTIIASKRAATESYGATLVEAGTTSEDRERRALELAAERGLCVVPPYDHPDIIAGQGTVALELLRDVDDLDVLVAPIGGGGLMAGCSIAARAIRPGIRLVGIEAADANDTFLSLAAGKRVRIPPPHTVADGMRAIEPGELTFPILQRFLNEIVLVSDDEILAAVWFLFERMKLVVEPTGAVGVAALLAGRIPAVRGRRVGVVLSGGNLDRGGLERVLAATARGVPASATASPARPSPAGP
jgi:threonine dehydratase